MLGSEQSKSLIAYRNCPSDHQRCIPLCWIPSNTILFALQSSSYRMSEILCDQLHSFSSAHALSTLLSAIVPLPGFKPLLDVYHINHHAPSDEPRVTSLYRACRPLQHNFLPVLMFRVASLYMPIKASPLYFSMGRGLLQPIRYGVRRDTDRIVISGSALELLHCLEAKYIASCIQWGGGVCASVVHAALRTSDWRFSEFSV